MLRSPGAGLVPVAVFDDDKAAHGLSLMGVPVVGGIDEIPKATSRYTIQQVLLTIPSPSPELVDRALRASERAGVSMKILPGVKDMLDEPNHLAAFARHASRRSRTSSPHSGPDRPRVGPPLHRGSPGCW